MNFLESFEIVKNRIRSFKEVDKTRFWLDAFRSVNHEWHTLWQINSIFTRGNLPEYVIQCKCGRLDIVNEELFSKFLINTIDSQNPIIDCSVCNKIDIAFNYERENFMQSQIGLEELTNIFKKAEDENYMTFCWYLWQSMSIENEQLNVISNSINAIYDQYLKNNIEIFLQNKGLSLFKTNNDYHYPRQYILSLLTLNHIIEIDGLYDLIISIAAIAESEHYLIGDDGHSMHPVGLTIVKPNESKDRETVKYKISFLKKWLRSRKYMKLAKHIQIAFNYELRNAFAHSEYKLTKSGVYLLRYKREISYASIQESFLAAYFLFNDLTDLIQFSRQKFIESKGYEESGWKLTPIISGKGFSVQITGHSPMTGPTGKKRNPKAHDQTIK